MIAGGELCSYTTTIVARGLMVPGIRPSLVQLPTFSRSACKLLYPGRWVRTGIPPIVRVYRLQLSMTMARARAAFRMPWYSIDMGMFHDLITLIIYGYDVFIWNNFKYLVPCSLMFGKCLPRPHCILSVDIIIDIILFRPRIIMRMRVCIIHSFCIIPMLAVG